MAPQRRACGPFRWWVAVAVAAAVGLAGCSSAQPGSRDIAIIGPDGSQLFAGSFWFRQLPADAPVDARSAELVRQMVTKPPLVSVNGWTAAVYDADTATTTYPVTARKEGGTWTLPAVPIPDAAAPDPQENGHLVVVDRSAGCVYELWQAEHDGGTWTASWVNATPADGDGVYPDGRSARSAGLSAGAGLIWPQELAAGRIDHALMFAYPFTSGGGPVAPATASNGDTDDVPAMPMGTRLRLDPTVDVDALGLTPEQRTIAVALQQYGMVLGDTAGGLTLFAAAPQSFETFPYPTSWSSDVWADVGRIPFDRMQVLAGPAQTPAADGPPVMNRCTQNAVSAPGDPGSGRDGS